MIEIPEKFDINILKILRDSYQEDFEKDKNLIHTSSVPFCGRQLVISKNNNIEKPMNINMLFGKLGHFLIIQENPLMMLLYRIYELTRLKIIKESINIKKEDKWEIIPGHFLYLHPDIFTNIYTIELKFTTMPKFKWKEDLAPYNIAQLNTYMGYYKQEIGFLSRIDWRVFTSKVSAKSEEEYWSKLWDNFGFIMPVHFNQQLFDITIERTKGLFSAIDSNDYAQFKNCEFEWECDLCHPEVRKKCGKIAYKCEQYIINKDNKKHKCNKVLYEFPNEITETFGKTPMCELCFNTQFTHSKYEKYKYINFKEMEENKE